MLASYLIFLKQRSADIAVEGVGEVSSEQSQSGVKVITLLSIVNRVHKKIHKPIYSHKSDGQYAVSILNISITYHAREYWYIGSILARSDIEKNRTEEWTATGL